MRAFIGFVRRPPGERLLIVHAILALMIAAIGVALLPFRWLARFAARPHAGRVAAGPDQVNRIARVIGSCAARSPLRAKCFEQGLVAVWLLRRAGYSATLHYGVARMDDKVVAHVWVLSGDQPVVGCANRHAFAELARFPTT